MADDHAPSRAIVIGGSIAGLLAARVLADYVAQVTIIERDHYPAQPQTRKGVPQGRHVHTLLMRGRQILEQLFPGFGHDLEAAGAVSIDWMNDTVFYGLGGWAPRFPSTLQGYCCSRDLLEFLLRQRLEALGRVDFITDCDVIGLIPDADREAVAGVTLRPRNKNSDPEAATEPADGMMATTELRADLVVDASGRDSKAPAWLQSLGYQAPAETTVNAYLGYASRTYQRPHGFSANWKLALLRALPPSTRGGVIYPIEGDRWQVTLGGASRDYPPTDEAGFLAFARSLASPLIAEALEHAEPLGPIAGYQRTINRLRHFERLTSQPERFLVFGDAACAFNPVYGQGMTAAALGALALQGILQQNPGMSAGFATHFQKRLAQVNETLWLLATSEDFRYPSTEGADPGALTRLTHRYMDRVARHAAHNPFLHQAFIEVVHLLKPPTTLFQPKVLVRVLSPLPAPNASKKPHA